MTTSQAFTELLSDKQKCLQLGMSETNYRKIKERFGKGLHGTDFIIFWLEKAGYVKNFTWKRPLSFTTKKKD